VPCPRGSFCGDALATGIDRTWLDVEFSRYNDDPSGTTYTDYWAERPCFRGLSCANASTLTTCAAGTWCPTGNAGPLACDPLSVCGARAYFQVNFIVVVIAVGLTALVVATSATLVRRQRAAAKACRAQASRGVLRALEPGGDAAAAGPDAGAAGAADEVAAEAEGKSAAAAGAAVSPAGAVDGGAGLDFVFRDVTLASPAGVALLHGVSGRAAPGRVTALLGPSGSGKTLLMSLLRDGGDPASDATRVTRGSVTVNGVPVSGGALRSRVGYVPKDDVLDRDLTPRELLTLSAALRLPAGTPAADVDAAVTDTLAVLGLTGVADVVVGGSASSSANISGGQLKRVSVGYELVARPQALFLDECVWRGGGGGAGGRAEVSLAA
jgi:ABC-type lipoprotein export system ATPase subunit